jgi:lysozyme
MKTGNQGIKLIQFYESLRLQAYRDPIGIWTIGYGHTGPEVIEGLQITEAQADEILRKDLEEFEGYVNDYVKVPLSQNQFDALVSFTFNLGPANLKRSTLLKLLNQKKYAEASKEFIKWDKAAGKTLAGLTKRRQAESSLFLS